MASKTLRYLEFEPYCEWKRDERVDTLIIELPEFKKEQLRVQVNKGGILKVTGERPTNAPGVKRRFTRGFNLHQDCDISEIRAKFMNSQLRITMPKKVTPPSPATADTVKQTAKTSTSSEQPPQQEVADQKPKAQAFDASCSYDDRAKANMVAEQETKLQGKKNVILWFGIAAVTMVAIGAFVALKYGSDNIYSSSLYMDD